MVPNTPVKVPEMWKCRSTNNDRDQTNKRSEKRDTNKEKMCGSPT